MVLRKLPAVGGGPANRPGGCELGGRYANAQAQHQQQPPVALRYTAVAKDARMGQGSPGL